MGTTLTTNYSLIKPNPFEEEDTWGSLLNTNWDSVDSILFGKQAKTTATTALAAVTPAADTLPYFTSASAAATTTITAFGRTILTSASAAALNTTLGLGTANSPTFAGMSLTGNLVLDSTSLYLPQIKETHASATAGSASYFIQQRSRGSLVSPVIVQNGDTLGQYLIDGHDGTSFIHAAVIGANVDGTPATNSMPTRLVFATTPSGGTTPLERVRIDSAGNVGIGAAPVSKLHVDGASYVNGGASLPALSATLVTGEIHAGTGNSLASDSGHLRLSAGGGTTLGVKAAIDLYRESGGGTGIIAYTAGTERLRVDASGRVGINTTPVTRLDIVGPGSGDPAIRLSDGTVDYRSYISGGIAYNYTLGAHAIEFGTNNTARMRIDGSGNVGIGGVSAGSRLQVTSAANNGVLVTDGTVSNILYTSSGTTGSVGTISNHALHLYANNSPRVIIDTSGDVGIGGAPSTKLHVTGTGSQEARITTNTSGDVRIGFDLSGAYYNWIDAYRASGAMAFATANTERMRIDSSGNVLIGTSTSLGGKLQVLSAVAGNTLSAAFKNISNLSVNTAVSVDLVSDQSTSRLTSYRDGAGDGSSLAISTSNAGTLFERMRIDASGNVLVTSSGGLGYGTGSGGTVTQATSKTTGVTLNKTNGKIITSNSSMAAGAEVTFTVTNSMVAATDVIEIHRASGGGAGSSGYTVSIDTVAAGSFVVYLKNLSGVSRTDILTLNFAITKAVTA